MVKEAKFCARSLLVKESMMNFLVLRKSNILAEISSGRGWRSLRFAEGLPFARDWSILTGSVPSTI